MSRKESPKSAREAYELAMGSREGTPEISLGPWASSDLINDPKHLAFVLSRYKFVAKLLTGRANVLEVGCGDALGLPIVADAVGHLTAVDWDDRQLAENSRRLAHLKNVTYTHHDFNEGPADIAVDAVYSVDVVEHIEPPKEAAFMQNQIACLPPTGIMIVGTPNATADAYASPQSKLHHINLKGHDDLRELMAAYFDNVFMFGMNDEVVHTGFGPMCHYLWAVGAGVRGN